MRQLDVLDLVAATDVIDLAVFGDLDQVIDCATVIQHMKPVANIAAVPIKRNGTVVHKVGHEQRQNLLGKLIRTVVVGCPCDDDRDVVGREIAVGKTVGSCLARRIRVAGPQFVALGAVPLGHAAIHLVRGNLHEAPQIAGTSRCFEQYECPLHVGLDEVAGSHDRPIDMSFGGEVNDDLRSFDERAGKWCVADVTVDEGMPRVGQDVVQVFAPTGVGELVERSHMPVGMRLECVTNEDVSNFRVRVNGMPEGFVLSAAPQGVNYTSTATIAANDVIFTLPAVVNVTETWLIFVGPVGANPPPDTICVKVRRTMPG